MADVLEPKQSDTTVQSTLADKVYGDTADDTVLPEKLLLQSTQKTAVAEPDQQPSDSSLSHEIAIGAVGLAGSKLLFLSLGRGSGGTSSLLGRFWRGSRNDDPEESVGGGLFGRGDTRNPFPDRDLKPTTGSTLKKYCFELPSDLLIHCPIDPKVTLGSIWKKYFWGKTENISPIERVMPPHAPEPPPAPMPHRAPEPSPTPAAEAAPPPTPAAEAAPPPTPAAEAAPPPTPAAEAAPPPTPAAEAAPPPTPAAEAAPPPTPAAEAAPPPTPAAEAAPPPTPAAEAAPPPTPAAEAAPPPARAAEVAPSTPAPRVRRRAASPAVEAGETATPRRTSSRGGRRRTATSTGEAEEAGAASGQVTVSVEVRTTVETPLPPEALPPAPAAELPAPPPELSAPAGETGELPAPPPERATPDQLARLREVGIGGRNGHGDEPVETGTGGSKKPRAFNFDGLGAQAVKPAEGQEGVGFVQLEAGGWGRQYTTADGHTVDDTVLPNGTRVFQREDGHTEYYELKGRRYKRIAE